MNFEILIDGQDVTSQVEVGLSLVNKFTEELDIGQLTIPHTTREDKFPMFSLVYIKIWDETKTIEKHMYVSSDEVEPVSKELIPRAFSHTINLIEIASKFDYEMVNTLAFTQPIEGVTTAPFEHKYGIIDGTLNLPWEVGVTVWLPEVKLSNSYYDGDITIPQCAEGIAYSGSFGASTIYYNWNEAPVKTTIEPDVINVQGKVRVGVWTKPLSSSTYTFMGILSEGNVTLNLSAGTHNVKIGTLTQNTASGNYLDFTIVQNPTMPSQPFSNIQRVFEFVIEVKNPVKYTLLDVLERVRNTVPFATVADKQNFKLFEISSELEEFARGIRIPQLYMNQMTVREAINLAFKFINAISKFETDGFGNFELDAFFFNERKNNVILGEHTAFSTNQDIQDYMTESRAYIKNVITADADGIPTNRLLGENRYVGLRGESLQLTQDTTVLKLDNNIYRLANVFVRERLSLLYGNSFSNREIIGMHNIDVTPRIKEEAIYNLMSVSNDIIGSPETTKNSLIGDFYRTWRVENGYYNFRNNKIYFGGTAGQWFPQTTLSIFINNSIAEYLIYRIGSFVEHMGNRYFFPDNIDTFNIVRSNGASINKDSIEFVQELQFNVQYTPEIETIISSERIDANSINKRSVGKINQNEKTINYERAVLSNFGTLQRTGVPKVSVTKHITKLNSILDSGDFTEDKYLVTEAELIFNPELVINKAQMSKHFSRIGQFYGVDRAYRPYPLPRVEESLVRTEIYKDYIEYASQSADFSPPSTSTSFLNRGAMRGIINTLLADRAIDDRFPSNTIDAVALSTSEFRETYGRGSLLHEVNVVSGKNVLAFNFGWNHNQYAGNIVAYTSDGGAGVQSLPWQQFIRYTDNTGRFKNLNFALISKLPVLSPSFPTIFENTKDLPMFSGWSGLKNSANDESERYPITNGSNTATSTALVVEKDPSEIFRMTYQIQFVPRDNNQRDKMGLGSAFFENNNLVKNVLPLGLRVYMYDNTVDFHDEFDDYVHEGYFLDLPTSSAIQFDPNLTTSNETKFNRTVLGLENENKLTHWAIGDSNGRIYVYVNAKDRFVSLRPVRTRSSISGTWQ